MSIVFTQTDLDNLKEALLNSAKVKRVQIGTRIVEYNSTAEIMKAIKMVQSYLDGEATSGASSSSVIPARFNKGEATDT